MSDPLQAILQSSTKTTFFQATSRYHSIDTATLETAEKKTIIYLRRRFVPPPERFALIHEHTVIQGDKLDNLAAQYLGDPEQFWRLCDANAAINPDELTENIGSKLRITLPEGIPGGQNE
jgi:hypothetical protein